MTQTGRPSLPRLSSLAATERAAFASLAETQQSANDAAQQALLQVIANTFESILSRHALRFQELLKRNKDEEIALQKWDAIRRR